MVALDSFRDPELRELLEHAARLSEEAKRLVEKNEVTIEEAVALEDAVERLKRSSDEITTHVKQQFEEHDRIMSKS